MEPPKDSLPEEIDRIKAKLKLQIAQVNEKDFVLNIRQRRPKDFFWVAKFTFQNYTQGLAAASILQYRDRIEWSEDENSLPKSEALTVEYHMTTSFSCCKKVFDAVKSTVESTIMEVSNICKTDSLELQITEYQSGDASRAIFVLNSSEMKAMAMANDELQSVMKGRYKAIIH